MHQRYIQDKAVFVSGKCDRLQRNLSLYPFIQAFQGIIDLILQGCASSVADCRETLLVALEGNGQILIDLMPRLKIIIGVQPPLEHLRPSESFARTNFALQAFLRVIVQKSKPLILFLDDLQWADTATFNFILLIVSEFNLPNIHIIGAYRPEEVSALHPLRAMTSALERNNKASPDIFLGALKVDSLCELLSDVLTLPEPEIYELAEGLFQKTAGNPFFVLQFLKLLYEGNVLSFDEVHFKWKFDRECLSRCQVTDNVVALLCNEIKLLSAESVSCLHTASLIGNIFSADIIASVIRLPLLTVEQALKACLDRALISLIETGRYAFVHDRVREAAHSIIPADELETLHYRIAQALHTSEAKSESVSNLFEVVNHFNLAGALVSDPDEQMRLTLLNIAAGERARASQAFLQSEAYFEQAAALLPSGTWKTKADLTFRVKSHLAESKVLAGKFKEAEGIYNELEAHSPSRVDLARLYASRSNLFYYSNLIEESVNCSLKGLAILGIKFPKSKHMSLVAMFSEIAKAKWKLRKYSSHNLATIVEMTNVEQQIAMEILVRFCVTAIIARPELVPVISLKTLNISLAYGLSPESGYGFSFYGTMLRMFGKPEESHKFHKIAQEITDRLGNLSVSTQVEASIIAFGTHFREHFSTIEEKANRILQKSLQTGDLIYSVFGCWMSLASLLYRGEPLSETMLAFEKYRTVFRNAKGTPLFNIIVGLYSVPTILTATPLHTTFLGQSYKTWDDFDAHLHESADIQSICIFSISRAEAEYCLNNFERALSYSAEAEKHIPSLTTLSILPQHYYIYTLALVKSIDLGTKGSQKKLGLIHRNIKIFGKWANECPNNFLAKFLLIQGELARLEGDHLPAMRLYEQASHEAARQGFIQVEALAYELASRHAITLGLSRASKVYMHLAWQRYGVWKATAKQTLIEGEFPELAYQSLANEAINLPTAHLARIDNQAASDTLDFEAIIRSSQTLSGEMVFDRLIAKLMTLVLQVGGARRAVLLRLDEGILRVVAEGTSEAWRTLEQSPLKADDPTQLPVTILNFASRSKESVILGNAMHCGAYQNDTYIIANEIKSVFCLPLLDQGLLKGILYLENDSMEQIFTKERENTLRLLSSQIAISIENAMHYGKIESSSKHLQLLSESTKSKAVTETRGPASLPKESVYRLASTPLYPDF